MSIDVLRYRQENEKLTKRINELVEANKSLSDACMNKCKANEHSYMESNSNSGYIGDIILYCCRCGAVKRVKREIK